MQTRVKSSHGGEKQAEKQPLFTTIPREVRLISLNIQRVGAADFKRILSDAEHCCLSPAYATDSLRFEYETDEQCALLGGLTKLLRAVVAQPNRIYTNETLSDAFRDLKIQDERYVSEIQAAANRVRSRRSTVPLSETACSFPTLVDARWRIDVALLSNRVARSLEPAVSMRFQLSDGSVRNFEMNMPAFHALRYNVARALAEMQTIERRNIVRVQE